MIRQEIPNMKPPFENVEQCVRITFIHIDWNSHGENNPLLPQILVGYEILKTLNGEDVTGKFKSKIQPRAFNNTEQVYQRSFEEGTLFQPIPDPKNEGEFLTMGSFDFIYEKLFLENPTLLIPFLKLYILDNYEDGWFDS